MLRNGRENKRRLRAGKPATIDPAPIWAVVKRAIGGTNDQNDRSVPTTGGVEIMSASAKNAVAAETTSASARSVGGAENTTAQTKTAVVADRKGGERKDGIEPNGTSTATADTRTTGDMGIGVNNGAMKIGAPAEQ